MGNVPAFRSAMVFDDGGYFYITEDDLLNL